jgi:hypothetical protein
MFNKKVFCMYIYLLSSQCLQAVSMTAADLCTMYKPWKVQEKIVYTIMDEFWQEVCLFFHI